MQRLLLIILTSIFLIVGCQKSTPEGILTEDRMVDLMTEVHLVDGYLSTLSIDSSRKVINSLYGHIFDEFKLDSVTFQKNVDYYLGNPTLSKRLYVTIGESMSQTEREFRQSDSIVQARISDSIQRLQYFTKLRDDSRELILNVKVDTLPLEFQKYHKDFISRIGISVRQDSENPRKGKVTEKVVDQKKSGVISEENKQVEKVTTDNLEKEPVVQGAEDTTEN